MIKKRNGHWHYRIRYRGKEYRKSTGLEATARNANAARMIEAEARKRLRSGGSLEEKPITPEFLGRASAEYLTWKEGECREHRSTADRCRVSFASIGQCFSADTLVHAIQTGDVERFKTWRRSAEGGAVQEVTIRHDLHTLSDFSKYAIKQGWRKDNPVDGVEIPSDADAVRDHVVTPAEEETYFRAAKERSPDLHDVARLILDQGMRPEEVQELSVFNYQRESAKVKISKGKSKAAKRTLLLTPEARAIVEARYQRAKAIGSPWLFPSERKPGTHIGKLNNPHNNVLRRTGLHFVLYEFRHTFATRKGDRGVDAITLAKLLGHSSLRTVLRYCHIGQDAADRAMRCSARDEKWPQETGTKG
jgi:site-specific recombinase XerD